MKWMYLNFQKIYEFKKIMNKLKNLMQKIWIYDFLIFKLTQFKCFMSQLCSIFYLDYDVSKNVLMNIQILFKKEKNTPFNVNPIFIIAF